MAKAPNLSNLNETNLEEVINLVKNKVCSMINCANVGRIVTFYPENKSADIELLQYKQYDKDILPQPPLLDVPILLHSAPTSHVTIGNLEGALCIIFSIDRDIDNLFITNDKFIPETTRMHSMSDCVALPCFYVPVDVGHKYQPDKIELYQEGNIGTEEEPQKGWSVQNNAKNYINMSIKNITVEDGEEKENIISSFNLDRSLNINVAVDINLNSPYNVSLNGGSSVKAQVGNTRLIVSNGKLGFCSDITASADDTEFRNILVGFMNQVASMTIANSRPTNAATLTSYKNKMDNILRGAR